MCSEKKTSLTSAKSTSPPQPMPSVNSNLNFPLVVYMSCKSQPTDSQMNDLTKEPGW